MKTICTPNLRTILQVSVKTLLFVSILMTAGQAVATIRYVKAGGTGAGSSWSDASGNLKNMITLSSSGDQVWVAGGTYQGTFDLRSGIQVYGGFAGTETALSVRDLSLSANTSILKGNGSYVVGFNNNNPATILNGFTITGGIGIGNQAGGLYLIQSSPRIEYCTITGNTTYQYGGGVYANNSSPVFSYCVFNANAVSSAGRGGGIYCENASNLTLDNCIFSNHGDGGTSLIGAAVYANGGTHSFTNCSFNNNATASSGGAIFSWGAAITLTDCSFTGNKSEMDGGCIFSYSSATLRLNRCTFTGNRSKGNGTLYNSASKLECTDCLFKSDSSLTGGAMYNTNCSLVSLTNCSFSNNVAGTDGGCSVNYQCASVAITGCTFSGNYSGRNGGCITNSATAPAITACTFTGNSAAQYGGAVYDAFAAGSSSIVSCTFTGNTAICGGALFLGDNMVNVYNCLVKGNSAVSGGSGGALYLYNGTSAVTNCIISGNVAANGGAFYFDDCTGSTLSNCTVAGNSATAQGGAGYSRYSNPAINNTIIYDNKSGIYNYFSTPVIKYSLVQGINGSGNGNIPGTKDPLFVNPLTPGLSTGGDYSLQPCSPAINAGSNSLYDNVQTTDVAGNARFDQSGVIDMGAYELAYITATAASAAGIIYVRAGSNGYGTSWACAKDDLGAAIDAAVPGNQIWVAKGTYIPNRRADATGIITLGDRNNAFVLKNGVKIYGGFAGTETSLAGRNLLLLANASTLSGDLNKDDNGINNNGENTYHVVLSAGNVGSAVLDGFTIQGGNCDGGTAVTVNGQGVGTNGGGAINCSNSSPILSNLIIKNNAGRYGAGLALSSSSPTITYCTIFGNAGYYGGGIIASNSGATLTNVLISGNTAVEQGGGMYNEWSVAPTLTNVTITGNTANYNSGAMYNNLGAVLNIRNSIIYGNNTGINNNSGTPAIQYSLVQGETSTANGNITGTTDPLFVNPQPAGLSTSGNYSLQPCSPAINAGSSIVYGSGQMPDLSAVSKDLAANVRVQGNAVDMGVYEFAGNPNCVILPVTLLNFNGAHYTGYNQLQWQTANENNTRQFVLERSTDGKTFNAIATVAASGADNNSYRYKDNFTFNGKIYYRLKMADANEAFTYSDVVTLVNNGSNSISLYPNPVANILTIDASAGLFNSRAGLYDANGRLLQTILITTLPQTVDVQQLSRGLYMLQFANGVTQKFIKK